MSTSRLRRTTSPPAHSSGSHVAQAEQEKLTVEDICTELKIKRRTFYEWRAKRVAPPCTRLPNGELRVTRAEFDAWLAALREA